MKHGAQLRTNGFIFINGNNINQIHALLFSEKRKKLINIVPFWVTGQKKNFCFNICGCTIMIEFPHIISQPVSGKHFRERLA